MSVSQSLPAEAEHGHQLPSQTLAFLEAFREQDHLRNLLIVRSGHGDGTEQLLQIVWQLLSAAVTLAGWVHGDEDARVGVKVDLWNEIGMTGNEWDILVGSPHPPVQY